MAGASGTIQSTPKQVSSCKDATTAQDHAKEETSLHQAAHTVPLSLEISNISK